MTFLFVEKYAFHQKVAKKNLILRKLILSENSSENFFLF